MTRLRDHNNSNDNNEIDEIIELLNYRHSPVKIRRLLTFTGLFSVVFLSLSL